MLPPFRAEGAASRHGPCPACTSQTRNERGIAGHRRVHGVGISDLVSRPRANDAFHARPPGPAQHLRSPPHTGEPKVEHDARAALCHLLKPTPGHQCPTPWVLMLSGTCPNPAPRRWRLTPWVPLLSGACPSPTSPGCLLTPWVPLLPGACPSPTSPGSCLTRGGPTSSEAFPKSASWGWCLTLWIAESPPFTSPKPASWGCCLALWFAESPFASGSPKHTLGGCCRHFPFDDSPCRCPASAAAVSSVSGCPTGTSTDRPWCPVSSIPRPGPPVQCVALWRRIALAGSLLWGPAVPCQPGLLISRVNYLTRPS
jgi:hypothetical protein